MGLIVEWTCTGGHEWFMRPDDAAIVCPLCLAPNWDIIKKDKSEFAETLDRLTRRVSNKTEWELHPLHLWGRRKTAASRGE